MNSDLIEISGGDDDEDSLLCLNGDVSTLSTTTVDLSCSPLVRSNSSSLRIESGSRDEDMCNVRGSVDKENVSAGKLSIEPQKMKRKKKGGGGYNLRKSLAWDHAFFTEEGVLDPLELSMLSDGLGVPSGEMLSVIDEGSELLSGDLEGDSHDLQAVKDNLFKELPSSSVKQGHKTTSNAVSTLVPGSCGREKKLSSASVAKRKVLSAHDINRSALKRRGCPSRSVPSSSPPNLNTIKAVSNEPKVSKLSTAKSDQSVVSAAKRGSKTGANPPKCNQKALPGIFGRLPCSGGDDDDDSILCLNGDVSTLSTTTVDSSCSPLARSNSSSLRIGIRDEDMCNVKDSIDKENVSAGKLSIEPQKMKRKKKGGGGYNLRKSLAWDSAFFTEEGVLDPLELSMLSDGLGAPSGEMLSVIDEGSESLSGDLEGDSHDLQAVKDNLFKELPSSSVKQGQKTTSNAVSTLVPGSCGREKKLSSASVAKRKVLSAHDINRSALKHSGCPSLSVPSSSLKRPPNLNTIRAVSKEPKVSKLSTAKSDQSVVSAANRRSKTAANPPKCNQKALPAINPKTNVGTKSTFTNKRSSTSDLRSGPAGKPILKSSIRPARNVVQPVSQSSTNVHNLTVNRAKTNVKSDSAVSVAALLPNGHDGSTGRISVSFSQTSSYSGANMRQAQPQAAKPSGLRVPSPSIGFFDQLKPASSHGLPQKSTQLVRPSESGFYKGKVGGPNLTLQKPPLPPGKITA